jgi:hypothetical protein
LPAEPCDDGQTCTADDLCNDYGQCEGISIAGCCLDDADCSADLCALETCNPATNQCEADPVICEPFDFCHVSACAEGECFDAPIECEGVCDPNSGCVVCEGYLACDGTCLGFPEQLPDAIQCDGACVNRLSDPSNCGDCGAACELGDLCVEGVCESSTTCPEGLTQCGGGCADLQTDESNCGQCDNVCPDAWACLGGVCLNPGRG